MSLRRLSGSGDTIMVQEADSTVDAAVTTLDFGAGFDVTSSPAGEANIALDLSEVAGGGDLAFSGNTPTILFPLDDEAAAAATDDVLRSKVSGDTQYRYILHADGKMEWGPGGSTAPDTNFYRVAADILKTDSSFSIGDSLQVIADGWHVFGEISDPAAPPSNFARLYARDDGGGKTQLVVRFNTGAVQVIATEP